MASAARRSTRRPTPARANPSRTSRYAIDVRRMDRMTRLERRATIGLTPAHPRRSPLVLLLRLVRLQLLLRDLFGRWVVLAAEHVALAPAGEDERRIEALVDLVPQVTDIHVHDVGGVLVVLVVEVLPDHAPRDHLAAVEGEELQKGVFPRG